jgi:hypothetical protein
MTRPHRLPAYLDECVRVDLADTLRRRGYRVATARGAGMLQASDEQQLVHATRMDSVLVTHNGTHFVRLHRRFLREGRAHGGIAIIPQDAGLPVLTVRTAMLLDALAALDDHRSRLFRWGDLQYLLARGHRLPGYDEAEVRLALGGSA